MNNYPGKKIFIIVILLTLFSIFPFALKAQSADEWPGKKIFVIGFAQDNLANDWRMAQVKDVEKELKKYPFITFFYTDGMGQISKQIMDIEDMIHKKVDILITSPMNAQAMTQVISSAFKKGIPVILLGRNITTQNYTCFIAPDNLQIARQAAAYMAQKMEGKGRILMLKGVAGATPTILRTQGFLEQIKPYPKIEIAAIKTANYIRSDAIKAMEEILEEGQKFEAVYAQSDSMATGARMALKMAGMDPKKFLMVGIDYISEARQAIRTGEQAASFTYPTCGMEGAQAALKILKGEKIPKKISIESIMVTRDNVEKIKPIF